MKMKVVFSLMGDLMVFTLILQVMDLHLDLILRIGNIYQGGLLKIKRFLSPA